MSGFQARQLDVWSLAGGAQFSSKQGERPIFLKIGWILPGKTLNNKALVIIINNFEVIEEIVAWWDNRRICVVTSYYNMQITLSDSCLS